MKIKTLRKRQWLIWLVIGGCLFLGTLLFIFFWRRGPVNTVVFSGKKRVAIEKINGRYTFKKDGKPFIIKGGAGYTHMSELAASGGNTVICWDTTKLAAVLDEANRNHLTVIIGIDIPGVQYFDAYKNKIKVDSLYTAATQLVYKYKDHPAVLAWCLGNELKFPNSLIYDQFYTQFNRLLAMVHSNDPHHPVCTTVINVSKNNIFNIRWRIPALDFIGLNIYNSLRKLEDNLGALRLFWNGPYFVSEWAPRGGWEAPVTSWQAPIENNTTVNAAEYRDFFVNYMPVKDARFLGSLVFYWGSRQEYTHTFYSIFNEDGKPTEIKEVLNDVWKGVTTTHYSPQIKGIHLDTVLVAKDNIIVNAGSMHSAGVDISTNQNTDSLQYSWQIVKEDWASWGEIWVHFKKPATEKGLIRDSTMRRINFLAPGKEGPYRVFVTVSNKKGYCANANIPFYVIE